MSLRDQILQSDDRPFEIVTVPEWGDAKIKVQAITVEQHMRLGKAINDGAIPTERYHVELIMLGALDPDTDEPVFDPADRDSLAAKSNKAIMRVAEPLMVLSGIRDEDLAEAQISDSS